jgi:DNA-binding beta-propeller fold protein YncE
MLKNPLRLVLLLILPNLLMHAQAPAALMLKHTIALVGVSGKFDHFAIDEPGHRLFAAATGNQSVEVIDLTTERIVESLKGLGKPHGLAWVAETGRLFVADGGKGELDVFAGFPLKRVGSIPLSEDADDMVYDGATKLLYVGHGGTDAAHPPRVAVVNAVDLSLVAELPVASHPEALELDARHGRIFVNIADAGQIAVIDGSTHVITYTWTLGQSKGNTPLAYDAPDDLLLVGCRTPAQMVVLDATTGKRKSEAVTSAGADDLFFDATTKTIYLIAGSGAVDALRVAADGTLSSAEVTHTISGAKTGLLDAKSGLLYVGIPGTVHPAAIDVFAARQR